MNAPITDGFVFKTVRLDRLIVENDVAEGGYQRDQQAAHVNRIKRAWDNDLFLPPVCVPLEGRTGFYAVLDGQQRTAALRKLCDEQGIPHGEQMVTIILLRPMTPAVRLDYFQKFNAATFRLAVDYDTTSRNAARTGDTLVADVRRAYAELGIPTKGTKWALNSMVELLKAAGIPDAYGLAAKVLQTYRDTYQDTPGRMTKPFYGAAINFFIKHPTVGQRAVVRALNEIIPDANEFQARVSAVLADKGKAGGYRNTAAGYAAGAEVIETAVKRYYENDRPTQLRRVV